VTPASIMNAIVWEPELWIIDAGQVEVVGSDLTRITETIQLFYYMHCCRISCWLSQQISSKKL